MPYQAIGVDGTTLVYFAGSGTGETVEDPIQSEVAIGSIPLANNAATATNQADMISSLSIIEGLLSGTIAVSGSFYPETQPVSIASLPSLPTGSNTIGAISNSSFEISGTLPAFSATPTFNIGTISTIATESTLSTLNDKIPSGLTVTTNRLLTDGSGVIQPISASSLPLPDGAATSDNQSAIAEILTIIQGLLSGTIAVSGSFYPETQPVSISSLPSLPTGSNTIGAISNSSFGISGSLPDFAATPTFNIGTISTIATATKQDELKLLVGAVDETAPSTDTASSGLGGRLQRVAQRISSLIALLPGSLGPKAASLSFPVTVSPDGAIASTLGEVQATPTANTILARLKTIADYLVAGIKSPANSLSVTQSYAATSTLSNVASSASSTKLLDANNNRKTAIIYNDSTAILYICCNASVASTTNFSVKLQPDGHTIINGENYSGEIRGIWASANGFARVTEVV